MIHVPRRKRQSGKDTGCYAMRTASVRGADGVILVPPGKYESTQIPNPRVTGGDPWLVVVICRRKAEFHVGQPVAIWESYGAKVL